VPTDRPRSTFQSERISTILFTGAAGFIGFHVSLRLPHRGDTVIGLDNLNDYYDVNLKRERLRRLQTHAGLRFVPRAITPNP